MIVISGVLVIVALVLLLVGLFINDGLALVYASIGVSLASAACLLVGVLQRRGEDLSGQEPGPPPHGEYPQGRSGADEMGGVAIRPEPIHAGEPVRAPTLIEEASDADEDEDEDEDEYADADEDEDEDEDTDADEMDLDLGLVYVVDGRPRYHVETCRFLRGRDYEGIEAGEAREEGFIPCGVCRPDDTLAEAAPATEENLDDVESDPVSPSRTTLGPEPATEPEATSPTPAAGSTPRRHPVVVIPERGRFHRPGCRYVRDNPGAVETSKSTARRRGYDPCGVCKP